MVVWDSPVSRASCASENLSSYMRLLTASATAAQFFSSGSVTCSALVVAFPGVGCLDKHPVPLEGPDGARDLLDGLRLGEAEGGERADHDVVLGETALRERPCLVLGQAVVDRCER